MSDAVVRSCSQYISLPSIRASAIGQAMLHRTQVLIDPHEALDSGNMSCLSIKRIRSSPMR